jgi:hypothetical protein
MTDLLRHGMATESSNLWRVTRQGRSELKTTSDSVCDAPLICLRSGERWGAGLPATSITGSTVTGCSDLCPSTSFRL